MEQVQSSLNLGGRSDVTIKGASHVARANTVPRPRKERAVPTAGQPLMAEPDFGTGKNVVLPFPSAQGRTLSYYSRTVRGSEVNNARQRNIWQLVSSRIFETARVYFYVGHSDEDSGQVIGGLVDKAYGQKRDFFRFQPTTCKHDENCSQKP